MKSIGKYLSQNNRINKLMKALLSITLVSGLCAVSVTYAANGPKAVSMSAISGHVSNTVYYLAHVLNAVALVAGVGFVMASFFKFHQHKLNPTQVPLSQGLTLLLIGAGLILFPVMLPTAKQSVFGSTAQISTVSGKAIDGILGKKPS